MAYVLRELGDWDRAARALATDLRAGDAPSGRHAGRGRHARRRSTPSAATARRPGRCSSGASTRRRGSTWSRWASTAPPRSPCSRSTRAIVDQARSHCRFLLERWSRSEDHHYAVWGLRWASSFFARHGRLGEARAGTEALSSIAARTSHPDALAALAHALGETALAEGHLDAAAQQISRAADLHASLEIPFERAQIQLRAGVALAAAGQRDAAVERLIEAHRTARRLGAAPLAAQAAAEVARLGESVERRLGRRAAAEHEHAGLSRRELEVMRLVASGGTNREIAVELVLSTRTVDMHVRNILAKLRCRSRTEAVAKAGDLGLLA